MMGHYITICKWRPNLMPTDEDITTTIVWVRVPLLPIEMFTEEQLMMMGNTVGKAIKVDTTSTVAARGKYAHVCVELNLNRPFVPRV